MRYKVRALRRMEESGYISVEAETEEEALEVALSMEVDPEDTEDIFYSEEVIDAELTILEDEEIKKDLDE